MPRTFEWRNNAFLYMTQSFPHISPTLFYGRYFNNTSLVKTQLITGLSPAEICDNWCCFCRYSMRISGVLRDVLPFSSRFVTWSEVAYLPEKRKNCRRVQLSVATRKLLMFSFQHRHTDHLRPPNVTMDRRHIAGYAVRIPIRAALSVLAHSPHRLRGRSQESQRCRHIGES